MKLKLQCGSCHVPAAASTRVDDNNLPQKSACTSCHKDVSIKTPRTTLVNRFDHKMHVAMGNIAPLLRAAVQSKSYLSPPGDMLAHLNTTNACAACHRGPEPGFPKMADCLVCHNKVDPPFSCETCHAKDAKLKPADHTPEFLESHSRRNAKLDKESCAVCHGRKFTCLGCH